MSGGSSTIAGALRNAVVYAAGALALVSCGGGGSTGSERDSGINKTYLSVEAADADGDALHYQWRATGGSIENRNSPETVWTLPEGPGLHFAYVTVSDGKGGWTEQQYAVASDALDELTPAREPITYAEPPVIDVDGTQRGCAVRSRDPTLFAPPQGGAPQPRIVYLPDVQVQVVVQATGSVVFAGRTDARGELTCPSCGRHRLRRALRHRRRRAARPLRDVHAGHQAGVRVVLPALGPARNLRLYGHVAMAEAASAAPRTSSSGPDGRDRAAAAGRRPAARRRPVRVNRFGDYALDARRAGATPRSS